MGVDNNGILFYGLPEKEVSLSSLKDFNPDDEDMSWNLELWSRNHNIKPSLTIQGDNGYDRRLNFIGFELADSGSYGYKEIPNLSELIVASTKHFMDLFGKPGKFYILNYQW